jgi:hypothetical protein
MFRDGIRVGSWLTISDFQTDNISKIDRLVGLVWLFFFNSKESTASASHLILV